MNQLHVYIYLLLRELPSPPSQPSRSSQSAELSSLQYTTAFHQLSVLHMVVYICQCYCLNSSYSLIPSCVYMSILYVSISILPCK